MCATLDNHYLTLQVTRLIAALQYRMTPLHLALEKGHVDVAELLIARGADVSGKDLVSRRRERRVGRRPGVRWRCGQCRA